MCFFVLHSGPVTKSLNGTALPVNLLRFSPNCAWSPAHRRWSSPNSRCSPCNRHPMGDKTLGTIAPVSQRVSATPNSRALQGQVLLLRLGCALQPPPRSHGQDALLTSSAARPTLTTGPMWLTGGPRGNDRLVVYCTVLHSRVIQGSPGPVICISARNSDANRGTPPLIVWIFFSSCCCMKSPPPPALLAVFCNTPLMPCCVHRQPAATADMQLILALTVRFVSRTNLHCRSHLHLCLAHRNHPPCCLRHSPSPICAAHVPYYFGASFDLVLMCSCGRRWLVYITGCCS